MLCISFKSWNQEHPIQPLSESDCTYKCCVYPSNLGIKSILYNACKLFDKLGLVVYILQILKSRASYTTGYISSVFLLLLCISFKSWNQEHPIQRNTRTLRQIACCVYPSNLGIKSILYNEEREAILQNLVVYILQILESRASYTTSLENLLQPIALCISFKSWNQEHPIQRISWRPISSPGCVYPSNLGIKSILYNGRKIRHASTYVVYILQILESRASYTTSIANINMMEVLCISFKSWNQEHPIQLHTSVCVFECSCVYPSNLGIKSILYNR